MPTDIGKGTQRILEGCLDRSVQDRWTIDMVDNVAWRIGSYDDEDDEVPSPSELLPPTPSRSQSRPGSIPEHAVADDTEIVQSPVMDRSASRTRSGRSRSRLSGFHPYQHDQHFPAQYHDQSEPSLLGLHSSILRYSSLSSSAGLSPLETSHSLGSSSSNDRGRGSRF